MLYVCLVIDTYTMRLIILFALTLTTSCEPYLCEDCYNVTQNGEVTYICVEYDCSREPQFNLDLMKQEFESAAKELPTTPEDKFYVFWEHNVNPIDLRRKDELLRPLTEKN